MSDPNEAFSTPTPLNTFRGTVVKREHKALVCLNHMRAYPDKALIELCSAIEAGVNAIIRSSKDDGVELTEVKLRWHNVLDKEDNPDGDIGAVMVYAVGRKQV